MGDWIIWQDIAIKTDEGTVFVTPGMKGKVLSLHDGFHMDMEEATVPPKAVVQFESGMNLMVDGRMKWEKVPQ